jgi:7-keto-8-aminopelargonate synthetase-like enzyme
VSAELVQLLLFSTNDYLGLSAHPAMKTAAAEAAAQVGTHSAERQSSAVSQHAHMHQGMNCNGILWGCDKHPALTCNKEAVVAAAAAAAAERMRAARLLNLAPSNGQLCQPCHITTFVCFCFQQPPQPLTSYQNNANNATTNNCNYAVQVGCGPRSSALVAGFTTEHRQLELELAALKGTQDALLFPTGYAANVAVVAVLAAASSTGAAEAGASGQQQPQQQQQQQQVQQQPQVVVLSDELNHASIIDGARLAARAGGQVSLQVCAALAEPWLANC